MGTTTRPCRNDQNQIPYDYTVKVRNRFKGLDLIDKVPDELWTEVRDTIQETGLNTGDKNQHHPQEKEMQIKAKWLSEEALQIGVKRRELKSNGEKERYSHLNAEFLSFFHLFLSKERSENLPQRSMQRDRGKQ